MSHTKIIVTSNHDSSNLILAVSKTEKYSIQKHNDICSDIEKILSWVLALISLNMYIVKS